MPSALALLARPAAITPPPPPEVEGRIKVLHFLSRADGVSPADFTERSLAAHEVALSRGEPHTEAVRGHVQHMQLPGAEPALRHFSGPDQRADEAVTALYYDSADEALTHFPAYERSLRKPSADGGRFHDPCRSFALYCREVTSSSRHDRKRPPSARTSTPKRPSPDRPRLGGHCPLLREAAAFSGTRPL
ncbi:EthD domain-containing protein [Streptomyces sp. NPDC001500]